MKKLLLGIAASVVAASMCFTLAACNNGNNGNGGDNSVNSEETWIKAFEDSVAATNYKFEQKMTSTGKYNQDGDLVDVVSTNTLEYGYDGAGLKAYTKQESNTKIGNEDPKKRSVEMYLEVTDSTLIEYDYEDDVWEVDEEECTDEEEAKATFETYTGIAGLGSIMMSQYSGTGDKEDVTGTIAEIYSLFSYNSKTNVYSATVKPVSAYVNYEMTLQISFKDGKLYKVINDYVYGEGDETTTNHLEITITYGGVSITIPQGAKDALESMNPDEEE